MAYSRDVNLFWKMLDGDYFELVVDNDMCYITYDDDDKQEHTCVSFDFTPDELVFMFGEKLGINMAKV